MSYMKQNKKCKQTLESVQYGLEISFKLIFCFNVYKIIFESNINKSKRDFNIGWDKFYWQVLVCVLLQKHWKKESLIPMDAVQFIKNSLGQFRWHNI